MDLNKHNWPPIIRSSNDTSPSATCKACSHDGFSRRCSIAGAENSGVYGSLGSHFSKLIIQLKLQQYASYWWSLVVPLWTIISFGHSTPLLVKYARLRWETPATSDRTGNHFSSATLRWECHLTWWPLKNSDSSLINDKAMNDQCPLFVVKFNQCKPGKNSKSALE